MSGVPLRTDPRRRRERGAISIFAALVLLFIAIPVAVLAVDVGRLAWNRRQLQEIADVGAIDAMRAFGQCRETASDPVAAAQASAVRNGYTGNLAAAPNKVEIGSVTTQPDGVRVFTAGGVAATATAVRVFATREVPFTMIASALYPGSATLKAEAVAAREAVAGISAGSFAARVDTSDDSWLLNPLFSELLGGPIALDAVSYENLLGASFTVGDLVGAAGVGSTDELLALEMSSSEYLELLAASVSDSGDASAAAALEAMAGSVDASLSVALSSVLDIATDGDGGRDAQLNAFDMLDIGAQVARGDSAFVLDPFIVSAPGVGGASAKLRILQAPRIDVGPPGRDASGEWNTRVRTGQVRMEINLGLGNILVLGSPRPVSLDLFVEAAQTEAHLKAIDCADASDPVHRVIVAAEPGLVRLGFGTFPDFESSPDPAPSKLVDLSVPIPVLGTANAEITAFSDVPFQSAGIDLRFDGPFVDAIAEPSEDNTQTVGTLAGDALSTALSSLLGQSELEVVAVSGPLLSLAQQDAALATLSGVLQPALAGLDDELTSVFDVLGLTVGGADITVFWLETEQPALAR